MGGSLDGNLSGLEDIWLKVHGKENRVTRTGVFRIEIDFEFQRKFLGLFSNAKISKIHESIWFDFKHKDIADAHFMWDKYQAPKTHISSNLTLKECEEFFTRLSISGVVQYQPDVQSMRRSITLNRTFLLGKYLGEIALLIKSLDDNYRDSNFASFRKDLFLLTQEFNLVTTPASSQDGQIELKFFTEKGSFSAHEVSDGILLFTAILAILHQPNPPKVILLEEPENGIHPRRIIEIYRLITKLAEDKDVQFFITTHSPILLNQFSEEPECVWVFDKVDGITKIQNLQDDILEPRRKKLLEMGVENPSDLTDELGENWMTGFINGVPPSILPE